MGLLNTLQAETAAAETGRHQGEAGHGGGAGRRCRPEKDAARRAPQEDDRFGQDLQQVEEKEDHAVRSVQGRVQHRLANDRRPGRLRDSEILIDFKILVGVVL